MKARDYVIVERTGAYWPGILPYRSQATRRGKGYRTREAAEKRARVVRDHYAARYGGGPDLRVVARL